MTRHHSSRIGIFVIAMAAVIAALAASSASAAIMHDIERKTEDLRAANTGPDSDTHEKAGALEKAIKRGEVASADLKGQITSLENQKLALENQKRALEDEKRALEKVQVVLTSGLIGALVTALVAILGVFLNFSRGRAERDLKRLEVLEKAVALELKGINVPDDIQSTYKGRGGSG